MLSRNDFAKSVLSRLTQLGAKVLPRYDELSYCFFVDVSAAATTGKSGYLRLEKWYDRYQEALLDGRGEQAIDDLARYWMQLLAHDESQQILDTSKMLPLVRARFDFAVTALRAQAARQSDLAAGLDELAWRPLADHLAIVLAEDSPQTFRHLNLNELTSAGLTWESALALAMKNLRRAEPALAQPAPFIASQGNIWIPATRQSPHTAAALLWPALCRSLPVAGQPVAFVPIATSLGITGSENYPELAHLAAATISLIKTTTDKPLCAIPLVLEGNQWRPWLPREAHPAYAAIRELWVLHQNGLYAEQTKHLRQKFEGDDEAPYVASFNAAAIALPSGARKYATMAVWTETLATLLPKTDEVMLKKLLNRGELDADENAEPQFGEQITVPWQELAQHLGDKLLPQGMFPERYLVGRDAFPAGGDWDRLVQIERNAAPIHDPVVAPSAPAAPVVRPAPAAPVGMPPMAPVPSMAPAPLQAAAAPQWQPPMTASKIPVAPPRRPPLWPVILAIAIPVGFLLMLLLGVSLFFYSRLPGKRTTVAQPMGNAPATNNFPLQRPVLNQPGAGFSPLPPANIEPPEPRRPQYIVKLPWTDAAPFAELGRPEAPLPRLEINKDDLLLSGRPLTERLNGFREQVPDGGWLVGLRIVRSFNWGGAVQSLQPIYQVEDKYQLGRLCGAPGGAAQTEVLARPGYAIGKIECRAGLVNNAVRLTIFKVKDQGLDTDDSYTTEWLGSEGGGEMPPIGGRGEIIVGLAGTFHPGDDLVELQGLVTMPLPKVEQPLPRSEGIARSGASTPERRSGGFSDQAPAGGWLVGLRVFQGESWGGAPLAIQPIYQVGDKYVLGTRLGKDGGELHQWVAPPGYAVGEIWADQGLVVHRLQLRYQKVADGSLDAKDSKDSPRLGPEGGRQHCLSSEGRPIVGVNVELGGDISSLGIIVADK
jgi:hypothetical protein